MLLSKAEFIPNCKPQQIKNFSCKSANNQCQNVVSSSLLIEVLQKTLT